MKRMVVMLLVLLPAFFVPAQATERPPLYFIDAHSQVDHEVLLELVIRRMDEAGVYRTILSTRGRRPPEDVAAFAERNPDRIVPAVRTKGRAYQTGQGYFTELENQVRGGRFRAMAEVLLYHARKDSRALEVTVEIGDRRVEAALAAALANKWPFVPHIEFAALRDDGRRRFMDGLERMLAAHPKHPFALIHMGQLTAPEVRRLIETHRNVHFLTSHASPRVLGSKQPWINMFSGDELAGEWRELITTYPERFVFAIDNVWAKHWQDEYLAEVARWRKAIGALPAATAHAVAHGNAERLWRLAPKPPQ
jgi:predicted TIM-barrel fold metal-dependent hydrolase